MSKTKMIVLTFTVLVLALGVLAFTPFTGISQTDPGDEVEPTALEPLQALADALGISVEDLQAAYEAAAQTAREQSISEALESGLITQEQADEMLSTEDGFGRGRRGGSGFAGADLDALVAAELGISEEDFQAAQEEVFTVRIEQALADGNMTQTAADLALARHAAGNYFEQARSDAYQNAVQNALDDGAISQVQADLLLENMEGGFGGRPFGGLDGMPFGGRGGPGGRTHPHGEPPSGD